MRCQDICGTEVACSCTQESNTDKRVAGETTYHADDLTYTWSASRGSWKEKEGPDNEGRNVTWIAPDTPSASVNADWIKVMITDAAVIPPGESGDRDDEDETDTIYVTVWDAEIEKCSSGWLPTKDGTTDITARIKPTGVTGTIKFTLYDHSSELGYCINRGMETSKDLQFVQDEQTGFTVGGTQNCEATSDTEINSGTVTVHSYDYGAYGQIKAEATACGSTKTAHVVGGEAEFVRIPRDDDDNQISDAWTYNTGGADDDADTSLNNQHNGDGLTRYEEYRGVDINDNQEISASERLNPNRKDLFVQGSGFGGDFPAFAYGNAFAEAQIEVHEFVGPQDRYIDLLVVTLSDTGDHIYRRGAPFGSGVRNWCWSTKGSSTVGDANNYGSPQVNKKATNYYFSDNPHADENTWTAVGQWAGAPNGVLDPVNPERVEDTNDNGVLDGNEKDGATSAPTDDGDNDFDGDYPVKSGATWDWNQELSPMDIDNDGKVELPMDNQVPVPGDDEYTKAQAVRHTITHEMGHAVGIDGPFDSHCDDDTCVMYRFSNNWKRDGHFCNDCRGMVLIHNN